MTILKNLEKNISEIYDTWENLSDQEKRQKINLIIPIIQVVSYLEHLQETHSTDSKRYDAATGETYHDILGKFRNDYQKIFYQDLTLTETSDISQKLMTRLTEAQSDPAKALTAAENEQLLSYDKKYIHAHSRSAFNYGRFLTETLPNLDPKRSATIQKKIAAIQNSQDEQEVLSQLVSINTDFDLELHSKHLAKDDLENHALLNQMSNWLQHIAQIPQILLSEETKAATIKILKSQHSPQQMEIVRPQQMPDQTSIKEMEKILAEKDMSAATGIETEFLLRPLQKEVQATAEKSAVQKNIEIKKIIGDLNARRKMQKKYGLQATVAEITDARPLFTKIENAADLEGGISTEDYEKITDHIKAHFDEKVSHLSKFYEKLSHLSKFDEKLSHLSKFYEKLSHLSKFDEAILPLMQGRNEVLDQVANFTEAETFFYKLFFLTSDKEIDADHYISSIRKVDMDGIYSPSKSKAENLDAALTLIARGRFHENLLDMIEACEVSFGPYPFSQVMEQKSKAIEGMRQLANKSNASIDNPNIQLNLSFQIKNRAGKQQHIFMPHITGREAAANMKFNALGLEFTRLIEAAVAESAGISGVLRNQKEIGAAYDRKKTIGANEASQLWGSTYLQIDPDKPAFLNHRSLAAKNDTLRFSTIRANSSDDEIDGIAVCEIRLVGNNPHFARFNDSQTVNANGLDFIPEHLMPKIAEKIRAFVEGKSRDELLDLLETPVQMHSNGRFEGLDAAPITEGIERDNMHSLLSKREYIAEKFSLLNNAKNSVGRGALQSQTVDEPLPPKSSVEKIHSASQPQITGRGAYEI